MNPAAVAGKVMPQRKIEGATDEDPDRKSVENEPAVGQLPPWGCIVAIIFALGVVLHGVLSVPLGPPRRTLTLVLAVAVLLALLAWHYPSHATAAGVAPGSPQRT